MIVREIDSFGTIPVKRDQENYIDGVAGLNDALDERVVSRPAAGQRQVYNLIWDPASEQLIVEISSESEVE